jgi:preprotein translocase subunit SecE
MWKCENALPRRNFHICHIFHIYTLFKMNKVTAYFSESYKELVDKVTWPTWAQLQQSTLIVLVATLIITLVVGLMDLASKSVLTLIYSLFKS